MNERVSIYLDEVNGFKAQSIAEVEAFRVKFLSRKGVVASFFSELKDIPVDQKKSFGQSVNTLKNAVEDKIFYLKKSIAEGGQVYESQSDLSRPAESIALGARHPISIVKNEIITIFSRIGFTVSQGPEIEDDWHNFTALNLPKHHPARDMQDTFFIQSDPDLLLRTHTSSVQVRYMENNSPPIRTISPGRVYRNEAISARSHCFFHQIEGLYVDKLVSFADLKQTLQYFTTSLFGKSKIRLRPSYFPFTEPSAEVDVYWGLKNETDYRITKGTGWLEIMGCGMIDPEVLKNCKIDPKVYSGFALGMGIERIALLLYGISDIRTLFENDMRFLSQFQSAW